LEKSELDGNLVFLLFKVTAYRGVVSILTALNSSAARIRFSIPNFFRYHYGSHSGIQNHIADGGADMFDNGNKVGYWVHNKLRAVL